VPKDLPTTRFIFVRHGQTIWNHDHRYAGSGEVALSDDAQEQIRRVSKQLTTIPIDVIYSSPLTRCIDTITPTAKYHHKRILIREELRERNLGSWQGKSPSEIHPTHGGYHFPESAYNGDFRIADAEPMDELEHRVRTLLHELREAHPNQTVALATHAGVIWMVEAHIISNPPKHILWPGNCQITTIISEGQHYLLKETLELDQLPK
jgi:broad specificity phosphatase PhoE